MTGKTIVLTRGETYRLALEYSARGEWPPASIGWMQICVPWSTDEQCEVRLVCVDESGPDRAEIRIPYVAKMIMSQMSTHWPTDGPADFLMTRCCLRCFFDLARRQVEAQTWIYHCPTFTPTWEGAVIGTGCVWGDPR